MIHLDHAATSHPKAPGVLAALGRWYEQLGVSADRGDSTRCLQVDQEVSRLRARLASACGYGQDRTAFVSGATEGLNLTLRALLRPGDRVLTTAFEHSSVVRPLRALERERDLSLRVLFPSPEGGMDCAVVAEALEQFAPRVLVFTHASNVTGAMFDAAAFCDLARRRDALTVLDASQTAGLHDLAVGADLVVAGCHKSILGPPGLGFVAARDGLELPAQKQGGTGSSRALEEHPSAWPGSFEAGTPNTPAMLACLAALEWIEQEGRDRLAARCLDRTLELEEQLARCDRTTLLRPPPGPRTAVTSLVHRDLDPAELGIMLASAEIQARSGFHCAPWIHEHLGTSEAGTVRLSPGPFVSADDIRSAATVVAC